MTTGNPAPDVARDTAPAAAEPAWETERITWHIDHFTADNPFIAELVVQTSATEVILNLDPTSLNALHDALTHVRTAQRVAILGDDTPPTSPSGASDTEVVEPHEVIIENEPATPRRKTGLIILGSLVTLALLYSLVAGAILV